MSDRGWGFFRTPTPQGGGVRYEPLGVDTRLLIGKVSGLSERRSAQGLNSSPITELTNEANTGLASSQDEL